MATEEITGSVEKCELGPAPVEGPHEAHEFIWDGWKYDCPGA
jgi:hypothetical protein